MGITRKYSRYQGGPSTDWLLGNTGETITVELDVKMGFYFTIFDANSESDLDIRSNGTITLTSLGDWKDYGFQEGDELRIQYTLANHIQGSTTYHTLIYLITEINGNILDFDPSQSSSVFGKYPIATNTEARYYILAYPSEAGTNGAPKRVQGVEIEYTLNDNEDDAIVSFIDKTTTKLFYPDLQSLGVNSGLGQMTYIDQKSGMGMSPLQSPRIYRLADDETLQLYFALYGFKRQRFKITMKYVIHSFFDNTNNLLGGVPPVELVETASLTDRFQIFCTPEFNNPNTGILLKSTEVDGNTGWFNENFNGLPEKFILEAVRFYDTNFIERESLAYNVPTAIEFEISGVDLSNLDNIALEFGLIWVPESDEYYKDTERHLLDSLFHVSGREAFLQPYYIMGEFPYVVYGQSSGYDGMRFNALNAQIVVAGANTIKFIMWVSPTVALTDFLDSITEHTFCTWVSVTDNLDEAPNLSNRVPLMKAGEMKYIEFNDGAYPQNFNILPHPFNIDSQASSNYTGFVKDDVCLRVRFKVDMGIVSRLRKISFGMEIFKDSGLTYTLERVPVNLTVYPLDAEGIQQVSVDSTRGFLLPDGNLMNFIKVEREPLLDIDSERAYVAYFGMKMRWEDWIPRTDNVPQDFVSPLKGSLGKNNDWFDYHSVDEWNLNVVVFTELEEIGGAVKNYKNRYPISLKEYEDSDISVSHVYKKLSDGSVLDAGTLNGRPQGGISSDEGTIIEITYTLSSGAFDTTKTYANITIEPYLGQGIMAESQISSVWTPEDANPLRPLSGETKLKMEFSAGDTVLKTSCRVDPSLLQSSIRYEISGRVGEASFDIVSPPTGGIYEDIYESQYE